MSSESKHDSTEPSAGAGAAADADAAGDVVDEEGPVLPPPAEAGREELKAWFTDANGGKWADLGVILFEAQPFLSTVKRLLQETARAAGKVPGEELCYKRELTEEEQAGFRQLDDFLQGRSPPITDAHELKDLLMGVVIDGHETEVNVSSLVATVASGVQVHDKLCESGIIDLDAADNNASVSVLLDAADVKHLKFKPAGVAKMKLRGHLRANLAGFLEAVRREAKVPEWKKFFESIRDRHLAENAVCQLLRPTELAAGGAGGASPTPSPWDGAKLDVNKLATAVTAKLAAYCKDTDSQREHLDNTILLNRILTMLTTVLATGRVTSSDGNERETSFHVSANAVEGVFSPENLFDVHHFEVAHVASLNRRGTALFSDHVVVAKHTEQPVLMCEEGGLRQKEDKSSKDRFKLLKMMATQLQANSERAGGVSLSPRVVFGMLVRSGLHFSVVALIHSHNHVTVAFNVFDIKLDISTEAAYADSLARLVACLLATRSYIVSVVLAARLLADQPDDVAEEKYAAVAIDAPAADWVFQTDMEHQKERRRDLAADRDAGRGAATASAPGGGPGGAAVAAGAAGSGDDAASGGASALAADAGAHAAADDACTDDDDDDRSEAPATPRRDADAAAAGALVVGWSTRTCRPALFRRKRDDEDDDSGAGGGAGGAGGPAGRSGGGFNPIPSRTTSKASMPKIANTGGKDKSTAQLQDMWSAPVLVGGRTRIRTSEDGCVWAAERAVDVSAADVASGGSRWATAQATARATQSVVLKGSTHSLQDGVKEAWCSTAASAAGVPGLCPPLHTFVPDDPFKWGLARFVAVMPRYSPLFEDSGACGLPLARDGVAAVARFARQLLTTLAGLHRLRILHLDVSKYNVVLRSASCCDGVDAEGGEAHACMDAVLVDFGHSELCGFGLPPTAAADDAAATAAASDVQASLPSAMIALPNGTRGYLAPEVEFDRHDDSAFSPHVVTTAVDMYAAGCVIDDVLNALDDVACVEGPTAAADAEAERRRVCDVGGGRDLVRKLTYRKPAERLTAAAALRHPFVADIDATGCGRDRGGDLSGAPVRAARAPPVSPEHAARGGVGGAGGDTATPSPESGSSTASQRTPPSRGTSPLQPETPHPECTTRPIMEPASVMRKAGATAHEAHTAEPLATPRGVVIEAVVAVGPGALPTESART